MKTWIYNPFTYLAGLKALLIGLIIVCLSAFLGTFNNVHFDGVIDMHMGTPAPASFFYLETLISILVMSVCLFISGLILSKSKIRIIDVIGTQTLSKAPMIVLAIIAFIPYFHFSFSPDMKTIPVNAIVIALLCIPFTIWSVILMYNAYSVSCNISGNKAIISFIVVLIISEILSKLLIVSLLKYL